jgi:hypothetical protein
LRRRRRIWRASCSNHARFGGGIGRRRRFKAGYPPVLPLDAEQRARWFEGYVTTYLERDLQQIAGISALVDFRRLLQVAALRLGGILNQADLARDAALSRPTAHRYLNLLEVSFQLRKLPAYAVNPTTRLVKSPKLYWTDTGLAAHLGGVASAAELPSNPRSGAFLENLVLAELDAWRECVAPRPEVFYWRTASGAEVDFVIEHQRRLVPNQAGLAVPADRDLAIGLDGRRRPLVQRESRCELRERCLDLIEHGIRRIRAVSPAKEQKPRTVASHVDDVGSSVPDRGVLGEAQDVAGPRHGDRVRDIAAIGGPSASG